MIITDLFSADYLAHHGILGQKWGVRRFQNEDGTWTEAGKERRKANYDVTSLVNQLKTFSYDDSVHGLQAPSETASKESGNCHDQVVYEMNSLRALGYDPRARFLIETDPESGQGGTTHSYVYYKNNDGQYVWMENAWGDYAGLHSYDTEDDLLIDVRRKFSQGSEYPTIIESTFDDKKLKPGDSLQDIVDKCLQDDSLVKEYDILKHYFMEVPYMNLLSNNYLVEHGMPDTVLMHYGQPRRSGRYPYGSGKRPRAAIEAGDVTDTAESKTKKTVKEKIDDAFSPTIKIGKDKAKISPAEKVAKETGKIVTESSNIASQLDRLSKASHQENLSDFSDKELQDMVNRMRLERQYEELNGANTNSGYAATKEVLDTVGSLVGVTGSILAIISTVKGLKV